MVEPENLLPEGLNQNCTDKRHVVSENDKSFEADDRRDQQGRMTGRLVRRQSYGLSSTSGHVEGAWRRVETSGGVWRCVQRFPVTGKIPKNLEKLNEFNGICGG